MAHSGVEALDEAAQQRLHHLCKHLAPCACMHEDQRCCAVSPQAMMAIMHLMLRIVKGFLQVLEHDR